MADNPALPVGSSAIAHHAASPVGSSPASGDRAAPPLLDLAVVGAGPAGLAGAIGAADAGCRVALLDLGARPGGQFWRHGDPSLAVHVRGLQHRARTFAALRGRFEAHRGAGRIEHLPEHAVWQVQRDGESGFLVRASADERGAAPRTLRARTVLIATGAYDRHVPSGWTLPGVMAVGGAQALLKGNGVAPGRRIVVAGTGPFLLSAADGLARAGARVVAVVEAGHPAAYAREWRSVAAMPEKLSEAAAYALSLARHRVPYLTGHAVVRADGADRVRSVTVEAIDHSWAVRPGRGRRLECDALAVGFGFVAQLELLLELGCATNLDAGGMLIVAVDAEQHTSVPGVYAAGEPTGVGGADLALAEGALAGDAIARALGRRGSLTPSALARTRRERRRLRRFARALARVHPVPDGWQSWCAPDTQICRCEEVTIGEVREAIALGARDARTVKLLARPGMGWCQGRICGSAVAALTAAAHGRAVHADDLRDLARRPLAHPVPLGALASSHADGDGGVSSSGPGDGRGDRGGRGAQSDHDARNDHDVQSDRSRRR
ncbi:MAG TPA: FAD/NAD(P)-binding oxidoreductase [Solirubrobacteraceae bacterium]|nr:FAD/NAD(P)-binding oxidoreductase [Solirubrobacteraceae bacterium]